MLFRFSSRLLAAAILLLSAALCLWGMRFVPAQAVSTGSSAQPHLIILDAGHGGADGGALAADGTLESDINLQITNRLASLFLFLGHPTQLTRTDEQDLSSSDAGTIKDRKVSDLKNRVQLINRTENASLISIHQNSLPGNENVHGAQVFYNTVQPAEDMAESVQRAFNQVINIGNEKRSKAIDPSIYLMKEVTVPAILVECGFLSNREEARLLSHADYQKQLSAVIAAGFLQYQTKEGST